MVSFGYEGHLVQLSVAILPVEDVAVADSVVDELQIHQNFGDVHRTSLLIGSLLSPLANGLRNSPRKGVSGTRFPCPVKVVQFQ